RAGDGSGAKPTCSGRGIWQAEVRFLSEAAAVMDRRSFTPVSGVWAHLGHSGPAQSGFLVRGRARRTRYAAVRAAAAIHSQSRSTVSRSSAPVRAVSQNQQPVDHPLTIGTARPSSPPINSVSRLVIARL